MFSLLRLHSNFDQVIILKEKSQLFSNIRNNKEVILILFLRDFIVKAFNILII